MFIAFITGTFIQFFILFAIVFIHEIGHFIAAKFYNWNVHSIMLWVFGGVMKTDEGVNRPIKEDIIVTVAGPLQHLFIFILLISLERIHIVPEAIIQQAHQYNVILLLFNLLPIFPLDGGKLLFYCLSLMFPYKQAHRFTIIFSIIVCSSLILFQLFILPFTFSAILIILFILLENRTEWKNHYYHFIRFLLNRLHSDVMYGSVYRLYVPSHYRLIDVFALFYRHKTHDIYVNGIEDKSLTERASLHYYFKENNYRETMDEIMEKSDEHR